MSASTASTGFVRRYSVTQAAACDGGQLGALLDRDNTASDVWADTAYRSAANLALLERRGLKPQFQRKKPRGRKLPAQIARGNATRARVRSRVEHVFPAQKCRLGLVVRTVGLVRARVGDRPGQSCLQPHPAGLAQQSNRAGMTATLQRKLTTDKPGRRVGPQTENPRHRPACRRQFWFKLGSSRRPSGPSSAHPWRAEHPVLDLIITLDDATERSIRPF
jgi:hypothetical protein